MPKAPDDWGDLLIDRDSVPEPLSAERYRAWLGRNRVFISSVMDDQLTPYRAAVRSYLTRHDGHPVMWETMVPQDIPPDQAYLSGVEQSRVFVLMMGERYGKRDKTRYSPTQQEANHAEKHGKTRLLFTLPGERDEPSTDWLGSMYAVTSAAAVASPEDLVDQLEAVLRRIAAEQQRHWIKLGRYVFPGLVKSESHAQSGEVFQVTARLQSHRIRQELPGTIRQSFRLTWPNQSVLVLVEKVTSVSEYESDEDVKLTCRLHASQGDQMPITVDNAGPSDQARLWLRRAVFGEAYEETGFADLVGAFTGPAGPTLPAVLEKAGVSGWAALGLTRLYVVDGLKRRWSGSFDQLEVGPAGAASIPIRGRFRLSSRMTGSDAAGSVEGLVPLIAS